MDSIAAGGPAAQASGDLSDRSLLRRISSGQDDAATMLYLRYAERLQALAKSKTSPALGVRFDAEDVVQSVFRTFFRRATEGFYNVPPGDQLWQLLIVIALNKIRKLGTHHRAQKRDVTRTIAGAVGEQMASSASGADEEPLRVLQLVVDDQLSQMNSPQREMVELRIEGFEVSEIAARTDRSKRTVERVLQTFRKRLAGIIDQPAETG